jgi:hypothetical protein
MMSVFAADLKRRRAARETSSPGSGRLLPPKKVRPKLAAAAVGRTPHKLRGNIAFGIAQWHYQQDGAACGRVAVWRGPLACQCRW